MSFNALTATATELRELLEQGRVTSVDLTNTYLQQIRAHNCHAGGAQLRAVISIVPKEQLLKTADLLDQERKNGKTRGPYHGIPFLVKDTMWTGPSFALPTTCGAYSLKDAMAKENADIVQNLVDAGLILLGKTNLSELAGLKGVGGFAGWSTVGGQTQSPYVGGGIDPTDTAAGHSTPAGSSSGSAVAIAAGMAPIALGTETDGSITQPSDRASLYSLKPTLDKISGRGILCGTPFTDCPGPMTKSPTDVAGLLDILAPREQGSHHDYLAKSFQNLRVGFLDPEEWKDLHLPGAVPPNDSSFNEQLCQELSEAIDRMEKGGACVKRGINLLKWSSQDNDKFWRIIAYDFGRCFPDFLNGLHNTPVETMQELVDFNKKNKDKCLRDGTPDQSFLEKAAQAEMSPETYMKYTYELRHLCRDEVIDAALRENNVDVLMGPLTRRFNTIAAVAGYPIGTLPLGYARFNGRAFGLIVVAPAEKEDLVLQAMSAWEATMPKRLPPTLPTVQVGCSIL